MFSLFIFKPGHWYIIVTCRRCKVRLPLFQDLDEGKGTLAADYGLTCPECGHEDSYQLEHYFHPLPAEPV